MRDVLHRVACRRGYPRRRTLCAGRYHSVLTACLLAAASITAPAAAPTNPPPRDLEFIPPEWTTFTINWKPTWDETLAANTESAWQKEIDRNENLRRASASILPLRRAELLKAMVLHFPAATDKHAGACQAIAQSYAKAECLWQRNYYLLKMARDYPLKPDVLADTYKEMTALPFDASGAFPYVLDWEFVLEEALALSESHKIPADHPVILDASVAMSRLLTGTARYDMFQPFLDRMERLGPQSPGARKAAAGLLERFGHVNPNVDRPRRPRDRKLPPVVPGTSPVALESLPRNFELEMRWTALCGPGKTPDLLAETKRGVVQQLIDLCAKTNAYTRRGDNVASSFWVTVDKYLSTQEGSQLDLLREAQEASVRRLADQMNHAGEQDELVGLFRRYPWARGVHEAMLELGERSMIEGRRNWAFAAFDDVARHASGRELRTQAQAGLCLMLAQERGDRASFDAALAAIPDDAQVSWQGGNLAAAQFKKQLISLSTDRHPASTVKLADLPRRRLRLPPSRQATRAGPAGTTVDLDGFAAWPISRIEAANGSLMVVSQDQVARYNAGGAEAVWTSAIPVRAATESSRPTDANWWTAPDRRPVMARGRLADAAPGREKAGGLTSTHGQPFHILHDRKEPFTVAAYDSRSGRLLWSTGTSPEWKELRPLTHPAVADDRLYVLAADVNATSPMLFLVCMESENGRVLWQRMIGRSSSPSLDLVRSSSPVTVSRGAVYCCPNAGIVARCDARDGTVEWVRAYAGAMQAGETAVQFSREGSPPLLLGDMVILAPRDHTGVLAFRRDTGELLWESVIIPSDRIVGSAGNSIVAMNGRWLAALDAATGRELWCRGFTDGTGSSAAIAGQDVILASGGKMLRIAAADGRTIEESDLGGDNVPQRVVLDDGALLLFEPAPMSLVQRVDPAAGTVAQPQLPMKEAATLPCASPDLAQRNDDDASADALQPVLSGSELACVTLRPPFRVAWHRTLPGRPGGASIVGKLVLVRTGREISAFETAAGTKRWSVCLPFYPFILVGDDGIIVAGSHPGAWQAYTAVIDPSAGRVTWARSFHEPPRFNNDRGLKGMSFRRNAEGSARIGLWLSTLFGNDGWCPGEVIAGAESGKVLEVRRALGDLKDWPRHWAFNKHGICYVDDTGKASEQSVSGTTSPLHKMDFESFYKTPVAVTLESQASGPYVAYDNNIVHLDRASGKKIVFQQPKCPQLTYPHVFALKETGNMLVVVSGMKGKYISKRLHISGRGGFMAVPPRINTDFFDLATGRHLGRQELPGVSCGKTGENEMDPQVRITNEAIVVADLNGVHIFAPAAK